MSLETIGGREDCGPLELSRSVLVKILVSDDAVGLFWRELWFPTTRAWGAPLPYTPSGDGVREGLHPLALSRGLFDRKGWFPTEQAGSAFGTAAHILSRLVRRNFGF